MSSAVMLEPPPMMPRVPLAPPTAPPVARAIVPPPAGPVHMFRMQSAFNLMLLTSLTAGLYLVVWFDRQVRTLSRLLPDKPVAPFWIPALWGLCGLSACWTFMGYAVDVTSDGMFLDLIISMLAQLACVVMAFQIRDRLNELLADDPSASGAKRLPFSALGTFFGNALYLQWKINKLRRVWPPMERQPQC